MGDHKRMPAAVVVDSGSVIFGQGMRASSRNGLALRVSDGSAAYVAGSNLRGGVQIINQSFADLENAVIDLGVPTALLDDAINLEKAGNSTGAIEMVLKWGKNNLRPTEVQALAQMIAPFLRMVTG